MNDLSRSGLLTRELLGTYTLIAGYAGLDGECWTPQKTLATQLGCSVRTLQRDIDALVDIGCLTERVRRESRDGTRGRAYSLSDGWRSRLIESHDTGVARLSGRTRSHTTPAPKSHDTGVASHTTPVSPLKRTREKNPEKVVPELPVPGARVVAAAPPPPPDVEPTTDDSVGRPEPSAAQPLQASSPPPSPARPRTAPPGRRAVAVPDTIRLSPPFMQWALSVGFTPDLVDAEMERMLDHHKIARKTSGNWQASMRQWLKHELAYAAADGRQPGVHAPPVGGARDMRRGGDRLVSNGYRPQGVGKPLGPIDPDIAATDRTWTQDW